MIGQEKLRTRFRSDAQNRWNAPDISGAHILPCRKKKTLDDKTIKKLQGIRNIIMKPAYLNVLIMFTYQMASKLLYLHMDLETFD